MKKKNILNRAMFKQVKSPAYGTGISANLVNNEERQRYNYGGRVGFKDRGYTGWGSWMADQENLPYYPSDVKPYYKDLPYEEFGTTVSDPTVYQNESSIPNVDSSTHTIKGMDDLFIEEGDIIGKKDLDYHDILPHLFSGKRELAEEEKTKRLQEKKSKSPGHPSEKWKEGFSGTSNQNWKKEYLGGDPLEKIINKETVVEDTNTIGLTEDEKNALLSSGLFSGAAAAATSKGKDWKDVLSDALGGGAAGLAKAVDPTKRIQERKEFEEKYGAATDMYRTLAQESAAREGTPEALYTRLVEKGNDPLTAMASAHGAKLKFVPEESELKGSREKREAKLRTLKEGDVYFDESVGWKIKGPGNESATLTLTEVHEVLQKKG